MNEKTPATSNELTPAQAADVIRYYHAGENQRSRERGWKDKVSLGRSALRTTRKSETILLTGKAILTDKEMKAGLDHIENPPKSEEYEKRWDELVNKRNISYDDAKRILDNDGFK